MPSPTSPSADEVATGKLVTDAVAAVIDEQRAAATDPNLRQAIDQFAARLATQFHNVPGYVAAEFEARATRTEKALAAEAAAKKATAAKAAAPSAPSAPPASSAPAKPFDAAAAHRELLAKQAAAEHK